MAVLKYYDQPSATYVTLPGLPGIPGPTGAAGPTGPTGPAPTASQVGCRVTRTATYAVPVGAAGAFGFDTIGWDTNNGFNTSTGVYTVPVTGRYKVFFQAMIISTAVNQVLAGYLRQNSTNTSSAYSNLSNVIGNYCWMQIEDTLNCVAGDTISTMLWVNATAVNLQTSSNASWMTIDLLGAGVGPTGAVGPTGPAGASSPLSSWIQTLTAPTVASSPYTITHNLGTTNLLVQLWDAVTTQQVQAQVVTLNTNQIQVSVATNMPNNVNVVIMGAPTSPISLFPGDLATKAYVDSRTTNLPAPITSGSGIQTFTDVLGDVWVAANGVSNGAWKRARDALVCRYSRAAAFNATTTNSLFPFDTVVFDNYSLYATGSGLFTCPVDGVYLVNTGVGINVASAYQFNLALYKNGASNRLQAMSMSTPGGYCEQNVTSVDRCTAGDTWGTWIYSSVSGGGRGGAESMFVATYLGTG